MRSQIINDGKRVDGRELDEVRKISASAGILPKRVHGSALFQRGLTQVLSTTTLGTPSDAQEMDDLNPRTEKTYLHHYNFPLFSWETRPMNPWQERNWPWCISRESYNSCASWERNIPYVLRVVSGFKFDGSTSMGSVWKYAFIIRCRFLKSPCQRYCYGFNQRRERGRILTDIQDIEDFLGDMDFKVAGTEKGIAPNG